jgi:hypothetical protein
VGLRIVIQCITFEREVVAVGKRIAGRPGKLLHDAGNGPGGRPPAFTGGIGKPVNPAKQWMLRKLRCNNRKPRLSVNRDM